MRTATQAVLFDLDSTLRDSRQRHHMSPVRNPGATWDEYSAAGANDTPIVGSIALAHLLYPHYQIHIVSGSSDSEREVTLSWLARNQVTFDFLKLRTDDTPNGDFKVAYVQQLKAKGITTALFVEDWGPVAREIDERTGAPVLVVNPLYPCQNCEHDVMAEHARTDA